MSRRPPRAELVSYRFFLEQTLGTPLEASRASVPTKKELFPAEPIKALHIGKPEVVPYKSVHLP
jgi:hypothetical protein